MIFPFLRGILSPRLAPFTFILLAVNLFVFGVTYENYEKLDTELDEILSDASFIETQGVIFASMIGDDPGKYSSTLRELATRVYDGDVDTKKMLGNLAIRNKDFMQKSESVKFDGDEVAYKEWKEKFSELKSKQAEHPSYAWGISFLHSDWKQYVTYQFSHGGFMHLFWNMVFLLIFGCFIEAELGRTFVVATYFGGGVVGAYFFSKLSGISAAPLVGASGAVTALMALVGFAWLKREKVRFFFWLLPMEGYFGLVALPSWLVLIVSLLPDLSGYLATSEDFGSVAYAAHLGGTLWGLFMAILVTKGILQVEVEKPSAEEQDSKIAA